MKQKFDEHIGHVLDGAIVQFASNPGWLYMKTCTRNGSGGVVCLATGVYITSAELERYGLSHFCHVEFDGLYEMLDQIVQETVDD